MKDRSPTYIARRKPVELRAEPVTEEHVVDTWEGPRTAFVGDYIMTGVKGERWPVPGEDFPRLYEVVEAHDDGALTVRKRQMELAVYQTYRPLTFRIRDEDFYAETGYFIVSYDEEDRYPCAPDVFFETFEVLRPATEEEHFQVDEVETAAPADPPAEEG